ncbi:hypothetical protein GGI07_003254 [Coemansia sp. Benny D115]|nr:hypothetical protein GGI07_003254 [Coemansia sp. Benny D115]
MTDVPLNDITQQEQEHVQAQVQEQVQKKHVSGQEIAEVAHVSPTSTVNNAGLAHASETITLVPPQLRSSHLHQISNPKDSIGCNGLRSFGDTLQADMGSLDISEDYLDDTWYGRLGRRVRRVTAKNIYWLGPLSINILILSVLITFLATLDDTPCAGECQYVGEPGLYLSAFGSCGKYVLQANESANNSCGIDTRGLLHYVSVSVMQFGQEIPASGGSPLCGKCMLLSGPRGQVRAMVVDRCLDCLSGGVRLAEGAFELIAGDNVTDIPVSWGPC